MLDLEQLCVAFLAIDRNDVDGATARFDGLFTEREGPSQTGQVSRKSLRPASSWPRSAGERDSHSLFPTGEQRCGGGVREQRSV